MMLEEDDLPKKRKLELPKLEDFSLKELDEYLRHLENEKLRAQAEIARKKKAQAAADSFFVKKDSSS